MLSKNKRVDTRLFNEVFSRGYSYYSPHLLFKVLDEKNRKMSRFSVSVSNKIAKKAVDRNSLRRKTYAVLEFLYSQINFPSVGVLIYKKYPNTKEFSQIEKEIVSLFKTAKMIS